jgi:hypothetical protein
MLFCTVGTVAATNKAVKDLIIDKPPTLDLTVNSPSTVGSTTKRVIGQGMLLENDPVILNRIYWTSRYSVRQLTWDFAAEDVSLQNASNISV